VKKEEVRSVWTSLVKVTYFPSERPGYYLSLFCSVDSCLLQAGVTWQLCNGIAIRFRDGSPLELGFVEEEWYAVYAM
jgi:hypothetical protein